MPDDQGKYTQEELDAIVEQRVEERNKGLEANRNEMLRELQAAKKALKNYDGIDPTEHARLKEVVAEAERKRAAAEGDWKAMEKQLIEKHAAEREADQKKIGKLNKFAEQRLVQAELTRAIAAKKGVPDLLLPYAERFARVRETDDGFEAYVCDEKGNPRVADGAGTPMNFDSFVEQELMTKFPRAFDGVGSSGGGSSKSNASGGGQQSRVVVADTNSSDFLANVKDIATGKATLG